MEEEMKRRNDLICPICEENAEIIHTWANYVEILCPECGLSSDDWPTEERALAEWRKFSERE